MVAFIIITAINFQKLVFKLVFFYKTECISAGKSHANDGIGGEADGESHAKVENHENNGGQDIQIIVKFQQF